MKKLDLIKTIAEEVEVTRAQANAMLEAIIDSISKVLKKAESVTLTGFGTFKTTKTKARKGRNPQTGKEIQIKAGRRVKFVAGKNLKNSVK